MKNISPRLRRKLILRLIFSGAVLVALFFALRLALLISAGPPDPSRPIEGWMTPRYIQRVYDLPADAVAQALSVAPGEVPRLSLAQLAKRDGRDLADLLAQIESLRRAAP